MTFAMTVHEWLVADTAIVAQIDAGRIFGSGAALDTPPRPYAVVRHLSAIPVGGRFVYPLQVAVHDDPGSYVRIDTINDLVIARLKALEQFTGTGGVRVVQADFLGIGGEELDPERGTVFKNTNWQIAVGG